MGKPVQPVRFSEALGIAPGALNRLRVTNPFLNLDTKLFIDPMLLSRSRSREMKRADTRFHEYFGRVVQLLLATDKADPTDLAWRTVLRKLQFSEVRGTCLGYGAESTHGSAIGPKLAHRLAVNGKTVVDKGIIDPDLFLLLAIFEEGIGADRISDMTTNIIIPEIVAFNERVAQRLGVRTKSLSVLGHLGRLIPNPLDSMGPVLLLPRDVVRRLPLASDFDSAMSMAAMNEELRRRISEKVGDIWKMKVSDAKEAARKHFLGDERAFQWLLESLRTGNRPAYDFENDPDGEFSWQEIGTQAAKRHPPKFSIRKARTLDDVEAVAVELVDYFKHLVENEGLSKMLWHRGKHHNERFVQLLFYAVVAYACRAANVDITPEAETGNGPVDFKLSRGGDARVLVELKLSDNKKVVHGYETQIEIYKAGQQTRRAAFVVIDVGGLGKGEKRLVDAGNAMRAEGKMPSRLVFIDGTQKRSASKRAPARPRTQGRKPVRT